MSWSCWYSPNFGLLLALHSFILLSLFRANKSIGWTSSTWTYICNFLHIPIRLSTRQIIIGLFIIKGQFYNTTVTQKGPSSSFCKSSYSLANQALCNLISTQHLQWFILHQLPYIYNIYIYNIYITYMDGTRKKIYIYVPIYVHDIGFLN